MKKRVPQSKLQLHRETIERLSGENLARVEGGVLYNRNDMFKCTGCDSGCGIEP